MVASAIFDCTTSHKRRWRSSKAPSSWSSRTPDIAVLSLWHWKQFWLKNGFAYRSNEASRASGAPSAARTDPNCAAQTIPMATIEVRAHAFRHRIHMFVAFIPSAYLGPAAVYPRGSASFETTQKHGNPRFPLPCVSSNER